MLLMTQWVTLLCCHVFMNGWKENKKYVSYMQNPKDSAINPLVPVNQESCVTQLELLSGVLLWGCLGRMALFTIADGIFTDPGI